MGTINSQNTCEVEMVLFLAVQVMTPFGEGTEMTL
jgi:hypothetical protein